jgi:hypothetical protein
MKQKITMEAETWAAQGGTYIRGTERKLSAMQYPGHDEPDWKITADLVLCTTGEWAVAWRLNADDTLLSEDDELPPGVLRSWSGDLSDIAAALDIEEIGQLADWVADLAGERSSELESEFLDGFAAGAGIDRSEAEAAWAAFARQLSDAGVQHETEQGRERGERHGRECAALES